MTKTTPFSVLASIITIFAILGCEEKGDGVIKREGEPDFVQSFDDARMASAIAEAKENIDIFISALEEQDSSLKGFAIKKAYAHGADDQEFIWINEVNLVEGVFEGEINNEPVNDIGVSLGQRVRVKPEEVEDWLFMSNGRLKGGYTIVALVYGTDDEEEYQQNMGIDWAAYEFLEIND
ncbi:MAG: DUF2314 domain-containing protein [Verrucomicrobiota bacterium]